MWINVISYDMHFKTEMDILKPISTAKQFWGLRNKDQHAEPSLSSADR